MHNAQPGSACACIVAATVIRIPEQHLVFETARVDGGRRYTEVATKQAIVEILVEFWLQYLFCGAIPNRLDLWYFVDASLIRSSNAVYRPYRPIRR